MRITWFFYLFIFLMPVLAQAESGKFRLNISSNLLALNSGYSAGFDVGVNRFALGGYYARAKGKRSFGLTDQVSDITEIGLRASLFLAPRAFSSSFFISLAALRDEGTMTTEEERSVDSNYCYISIKTSGVLLATKFLTGYTWFSRYGFNASAGVGAAYLMPSPAYKVEVDSINCSAGENGDSLKRKRLVPTGEVSLGWAF